MGTYVAASAPGQDTYGATIFDYALSGGKFAALTDDTVFVELIKSVLYHSMGLSKKSFHHFTRLDDLFELLHEDRDARFIICLERRAAEADMSQVMERIMRLCPGAGLIVLTQEVDQYTTALLVEQGAHNIITKPISVASFSEKLAFTIAPQGKLSKLIEKGKKLLESGGWGEALLVAEDILQQKPDSAVGFMIKGDAYLGLDMTSRAEEMYQRAVKSAELYLAPLKRLAALYEQAGDATKQLECLRRLNEISPLNTQRILHIGELEIARGNTAVAEEMFRNVMQLAQREAAEFLSNLSSRIADICANRDPDMAIHYSKKALDLRGDNITAADIATVTILGISLRKQGKWREAIAEYLRVLAVVPGSATLLYNMAMAYSEGGETNKALKATEKALKLDPALPSSGKNVAFNIGTIFQKAGRNGTDFFKKAYELDPNDKMLWSALKRSQALHENT
jgi:tetratricopeptide (TPR) repeat protein